jgi:hypothetical protein
MKAALACAALALAPWPAGPRGQAGAAPADVETLIARSNATAAEYMQVFRGLTAEETKVIEVVDERGQVEKRREIVSDLLVYQTARGSEVTEFRDVRTVDGKPVERRGERALELLKRAARQDTIRKELETIDREHRRYEFGRGVRNFAIGQFIFPAGWQKTYDVAIDGRERVDGHDTVIMRHRQLVSSQRGRSLPLAREFGDPPRLWRGRDWHDAETGQLRRAEREFTAKHPAVAEPIVLVRSEAHYVDSRFGILLPQRLVFQWRLRFSHPKGQPPAYLLNERVTFTYGEFRRFEVATSETIAPP